MRTPVRTPSHPPRRRRRKKQAARVIKVIVTGLARSGKSQFIESISQYTEWQGTPGESWFFGRVRVDSGLILHFLEPPTYQQFDFIWLQEVINRVRATGFIVMVDSTRPHTFGEFLSILYTIHGFHGDAPLIVGANKQDMPRAWTAEDIQMGLGISDIDVLPCVACDRDIVRDIVIDLLQQVMDNAGE
ncbi:MAG: GTPase domain-containing protein [Aggregatilineales bacterium]